MRDVPFEVRPIAGALGAELHGIDLSAELTDATIGAIRQALLDHLVIFFRDQDLPPEHFLRWRAASARRSNTRSSRASRAFRRSSTLPSSNTRRPTSVASGTPIRPICSSRRWRRC